MNCVSGMEQIEITCGATPVISSDLPDGVTPDMVSQGWFTIKQAYSGGVTVQSGYKKVNGAWTIVSDISTLFDTGTHYVKGN